MIRESFVGVTRSALHSSGYASDDAFWEKLERQGARFGNRIGVMCTADGKWLGTGDVARGLDAWHRLPESARAPGAIQIEERGPFDSRKGVRPPPGVLILKVFARDLERNADGT